MQKQTSRYSSEVRGCGSKCNKSKIKLSLSKHYRHMWGAEVWFRSLLTSELEVGEWQSKACKVANTHNASL